MPFAEVPGGVAAGLQGARERRRPGFEPLRVAFGFVGRPGFEERVDTPALRILSGDEGAPRRGADRRIDVELLEAQAFGGQSVDIRRLRLLVAKAREVSPAHVVDQHEDEVGLAGRLGAQDETKPRNEQGVTHGVAKAYPRRSKLSKGLAPERFGLRLAPCFP